MGSTKIVLVGAGSTSFGVNTLADLFARKEELRGSHVALCDIDPARVERVARLAARMNAALGAGFTFECATDFRTTLDGAEFVIVSVEVDRLRRWKQDWEIPFRYGVRHVLGENGGPGGLSHALRTISLVLDLALEVEQRAPNAYLLNYTNPLSRVCLALTRYTHLKAIGLCHQVYKGYYVVAHVLGLTPHLEEHFPPPDVAHKLENVLDLRVAGLNHITWIQHLRERPGGRDLYPEFMERLSAFDPTFEPLSRRLLAAFGLFPATGDGHAGEYFQFAHETSDLKGYDFEGRAALSADLDTRVERAGRSDAVLSEFMAWESSERAAAIISGIVNHSSSYEITVNVVNHGTLPGLPDWAVVEVPALVDANGVTPLRVDPLPRAITDHLNLQVAIQDRVVEAAVHGDRQAALQALLLDPVVPSYAAAEGMLNEFLTVHADLLPRFRRA